MTDSFSPTPATGPLTKAADGSDCSDRSGDIQPFQVMAILARAQELKAQGKDIIALNVGEPDFTAPEPVLAAAREALAAGNTQYTPALGLPALREKIAGYYQQRFGVALDARRVVITPGASGALLLLSAARLNPGDQLMLADPGYPCNRHFARTFEAHGQLIACPAKQKFQLTADDIGQHWQSSTKAALVATPANPTGSVLSLDELSELAVAVRQQRALHGQGELWVDEIYQGINYHQPAQTVLSVADDAVVLNSFSKYFAMTGWRLGWCVVPESWVSTLDTLAQNLFLAPSTPAQYAALAAFDDDSMAVFEQRRRELQTRRDYLLGALEQLGFGIPLVPDGAFYIYADARRFTNDSLSFCRDVLEQTGVAITPGVDFGEFGANTHVRFAFTTGIERLQQAVARLSEWLPGQPALQNTQAASQDNL